MSRRHRRVSGLALVAACVLLSAAGRTAEPHAETSAPADLVIANRPVFTFRAENRGVSPQGRAAAARARIGAWLERGLPADVAWEELPEGALITAAGEGLLRVTPGDLDPEADETLEELRDRTVLSLAGALREAAEARSLPNLLWALGRSAAATAVFWLFLLLLRRVARWTLARLQQLVAGKVGRVGMGGFTFFTREQLEAFALAGVRVLRSIATLAAGYVWLAYTLQQFPYTRPWGEELGGRFMALLATLGSAVLDAVPGLVLVALIVLVTRHVARLVAALFGAVQRGDVQITGLHPDTALATRRILTAVLWLFALALAYPHIPGSSSAAFQGVSIFAGLVLSLGSTNLVGQLMSGLTITYARQLRPGEYVRIGATEGTVVSAGMFAIKIRTNKQEEVTIPNAVVASAESNNYSRLADDGGVVTYTSVTIGYDVPWRQVHGLLLDAAGRTEGLRKDPPPFVHQLALSDFFVEYQLNARLERAENRIPVLSALHAHIQDAFNESGVQIMSPHYESDPAAPKVVSKDRWHGPAGGR